MTLDTELSLARAKSFCIAAHSAVKQTRKYTGVPYWHHPLAVAALVQEHVPHAPVDVIVAALLHDVVDDTGVTLALIDDQFGPFVAEMVHALSDDTTPADGNRRARKAMEREKISKADPWAKTIRLADVITNVESVSDLDPEFTKTYLPEKRLLLPCLREGDPTLFAIADHLIEAYFVGRG